MDKVLNNLGIINEMLDARCLWVSSEKINNTAFNVGHKNIYIYIYIFKYI